MSQNEYVYLHLIHISSCTPLMIVKSHLQGCRAKVIISSMPDNLSSKTHVFADSLFSAAFCLLKNARYKNLIDTPSLGVCSGPDIL